MVPDILLQLFFPHTVHHRKSLLSPTSQLRVQVLQQRVDNDKHEIEKDVNGERGGAFSDEGVGFCSGVLCC